MIRVRRPETAPSILTRAATEGLRQAFVSRYDADPLGFQSGDQGFAAADFDSGIYGDSTVKDALRQAQLEKCAWCERNVAGGGGSYGDVDHYRPKGRVRQGLGHWGRSPGYYWLAYSWTNLLFSCQYCNQRYKKDLFPLANPAKRAKSHHDSVDTERPLLVDPASDSEDPRLHIVFREDLPRGLSPAGNCTIKLLGLDLDPGGERARLWRLLLAVSVAMRRFRELPNCEADAEKLEARLRVAAAPGAPFSSMAQDLLASVIDGEK